jgi:outer membrane protein
MYLKQRAFSGIFHPNRCKEMLMKSILVYGMVLAGIVSTVFAEEQTARPEETFSAGLGLLVTDKPYKGGDTDVYGIPLIFYQKDRFVLSGLRLNYYFIYNDEWALSLIGAPRFEGYDDDESRALNGMDDRERTYELGLECSRAFDWGTLSACIMTDICGEHKGQEVRLTYKRKFDDILNFENLDLTPRIGVNWRSKQLNDYYYGVEGNEATVGRPEYHAGSSTGMLAGLRLDYPVGKKWNLFGSVNVEWLGNEITDSPIVNEHTIMSFMVGAMYQF